jgi:PEP-CTERM motif
VTATPTDIDFNFGGPADNFIVFQDHLFSGQTYWCNDTTLGSCFQGKSVVPILFSDPSTQVAAASGSQIIASVSSTIPEPSTWALLLIGFGALACGAHRRSGGRRAVA